MRWTRSGRGAARPAAVQAPQGPSPGAPAPAATAPVAPSSESTSDSTSGSTSGSTSSSNPAPTERPLLPRWLRGAAAYGAAVLVLGALAWVVAYILLTLFLVTVSLVAAVLLVALLFPVADWLRRLGAPSAVGAVLSIVVLLGVPAAVGLFLYRRVRDQVLDTGLSVAAGLDEVRAWLTEGPLQLDPAQVGSVRDSIVGYVFDAVPSAVAGTTLAVRVLGGLLLMLFAVFFLLKDGAAMWSWVLRWSPAARRRLVDEAGRQAWTTLTAYVRGIVVVAIADAVLIGAGLFLLGVPLWLSLTLLTFLGAFVPLLGATVAGAAAVLVTLVTNGGAEAVIVLVIVLAVQQIEGNILQPVVMGHAVDLHPLVVLVAVTCGTLVLGVAGAVMAVPAVAVVYAVVRTLVPEERTQEDPPARGARALRPR